MIIWKYLYPINHYLEIEENDNQKSPFKRIGCLKGHFQIMIIWKYLYPINDYLEIEENDNQKGPFKRIGCLKRSFPNNHYLEVFISN
jgi:hypothetical protein